MYIKKKNLSLFFLNNQMDASVFYTRLPCCTLRSWNCCCVSGVFTYFYLQLWNCRGLASPGFTPCLSCVGNHSPTPRLYNPAAVVTVEPSSCQSFPTPACDTMNRQPSLGSGTVHARRGALGACVPPPHPAQCGSDRGKSC